MTFYRMIKNEGGGEDALYIDGVIAAEESWFGPEGEVIARRFRQELDKLRDVSVYINSPGGEVFAGAEIYTAIKEHKGKTTGKVTGIAASIAAMIAMACDELLISPVGTIMIHDPWTYAAGNAREFEQAAAMLREIGEGLVTAYQTKTGKSRDEIRQLLEAETYMNAQTAIDEGFADGLMDFSDMQEAMTPKRQQAHAMMQLNRFGPAAVCAMIGARQGSLTFPQTKGSDAHTHSLTNHYHAFKAPATPAAVTLPAGKNDETNGPEREKRAEIARRAEALAGCYQK